MCVCVRVSCPKINEKQKLYFFWLEKEIRIQTHNQRIKWKQKQSQTSKRRCIFCFVLLIYWSKSGDHYTNTHITRVIKIIVSIIFSSFSFENLKKLQQTLWIIWKNCHELWPFRLSFIDIDVKHRPKCMIGCFASNNDINDNKIKSKKNQILYSSENDYMDGDVGGKYSQSSSSSSSFKQ